MDGWFVFAGLVVAIAGFSDLIKSTLGYTCKDLCARGCGAPREIDEGSSVCFNSLNTGVCNKNEASKLV